MHLRAHFPGSYDTAEGISIVLDTPTTNRRGKRMNYKLVKEVFSEVKLRMGSGAERHGNHFRVFPKSG